MREFSRKNIFWYLFGIFFAIASMIPYLILSENSIVTYHDQLDGEILTYILGAKHLFEFTNSFPELMNGIPTEGLVPPAPGFVLLYWLFKPFSAFILSLFLIRVVAYFSMYLLLTDYTDKNYVSGFCALIFMFLPFYPVYGFCIPAQPFIWHACKKLPEAEKKWPYFAMAMLYASCSSLALVGYALLIVLGCYCLFLLLRKAYHSFLWIVLLASTIGILYAVLNRNLVMQALGLIDSYVSHKTEVVHTPQPIMASLQAVFLKGVDYAQSNQIYILPLLISALVISFFLTKEARFHKTARFLTRLVIIQILISVFYTFYHGEFMSNLTNQSSGILRAFNFDRFTWLMPVIWYVSLAISIDLLLEIGKSVRAGQIAALTLSFGTCFILLLSAGVQNDLKYNLAKLVKPDYYMMTWKQFFAEDIFAQADALIDRKKEDYRVVSLGITPSAAAYNGFYCLDAYSNNYSLDYKHKFRRIIEKELKKNSYIKDYFDNWGNRCYLLTDEYGSYTNIEKRWNGWFNQAELSIDALKELGCEYIFAAAYLVNGEELGLELLTPTPLETEGSWYRLFVYKLPE